MPNIRVKRHFVHKLLSRKAPKHTDWANCSTWTTKVVGVKYRTEIGWQRTDSLGMIG